MPDLEQTIGYIQEWHAGQTYSSIGPYWLHPVEVMLNLSHNVSKQTKIVALLHDVIEDCAVTPDDLQEYGYPYIDVVWPVIMLTHEKSESYSDYVDRMIAHQCEKAMLVKKSDLEINIKNANSPSFRKRKHEIWLPELNKLNKALGFE